MEFNVGENILSPEDLAWVELCLTEESEKPESVLTSTESPLKKIINPELGSNEIDHSSKNTVLEGADTAISEEIENDHLPIKHEFEEKAFDESSAPESPTYLKNAFLPHFNDELIDLGIDLGMDSGVDHAFLTEYKEPSLVDIFKVWDLKSEEDEEDLFEELNKLAEENVDQLSMLRLETSEQWEKETVDDLVEAISGLSL